MRESLGTNSQALFLIILEIDFNYDFSGFAAWYSIFKIHIYCRICLLPTQAMFDDEYENT